MANELTLNASLAYSDADSHTETITVAALTVTVSTKKAMKQRQAIATSETTLNIANISAPAWFFLKNLDATNYVEIKCAASGTIFAKVKAGEFCFLRLGSGAQAPVAIANTGAVDVEYVLINN